MEELKECQTEYFSAKEGLPGEALLEAVREFLLKNGFFRSVDAFQEEMAGQNGSIADYVAHAEARHRFGQSILLEVAYQVLPSRRRLPKVSGNFSSKCGTVCCRLYERQ
jgi:hypothetical protein